DDHGGAVAQDLGDPAHHFGGVIADADDRIRAQLLCVLEHQLERLAARLLAEAGEQRNVAADQRLQRAAQRAEDRSRANHDAAYDAEIAHDAMTFQRERGGGERLFHDLASVSSASYLAGNAVPRRRDDVESAATSGISA